MDLSAIAQHALNPPVTPEQLTAAAALGRPIPAELFDLWHSANGFSIDGGLLCYATDEIAERNSAWEVLEYCPDYLAIGDNGAGQVFLIRADGSSRAVFAVGAGSMAPADMRKVAASIQGWIQARCPG